MMEGVNIFEVILTILVSVGGWFLRMLWDNHRALEEKVSNHQSEANEKYVRRDDFRDAIREIREICDKIFNRLDQKADK